MKQNIYHFLMCIAALPLLLSASGCVDDIIDPGFPTDFPEGETDVQFVLDYEPFSGEGDGTRGYDGKTMDVLDDLCIIAYDGKGDLMEGFPKQITAEGDGLKVDDVPRGNGDASNGVTAESYTKRGTFTTNVPYGRYYLYAVANLGTRDAEGNLVQSTADYLMSGEIASTVSTRMGLMNLQTEWDEKNPYNNFQMLGYFTAEDDSKKTPHTSESANDVRVVIDRPKMEIHSWIRRCASKVTIDFDGSELNEAVTVYIRRATIHDIPKGCLLGMPNKPSDKELITYKNGEYRPTGLNTGNSIVYSEGEEHTNWKSVTRENPKFLENAHAEGAESMFLYENMQGESGEPKNKEQHPDTSNGTVVGATDMKDNMKAGSYIEVEGYYIYRTKTAAHEGPIYYRFMLGKDADNNFDVERNYHLKLNMRIRGLGNDVDWHIEYKRNNGFEWKDPYYVSYLYNQSSTIHFNYTPEDGKEVERIEAEIIGNNWWPTDNTAGVFTKAQTEQFPFTAPLDYNNTSNYTVKNANIYSDSYGDKMKGRTKYLGNGFLSLYYSEALNINMSQTIFPDTPKDKYGKYEMTKYSDNTSMNDRWFYGEAAGSPGDQSRRTYYPGKGNSTQNPQENYTFESHEDKSIRVSIPVFTRPKNLVKQTAYGGNNPYDGSIREAFVLFKVFYKDNTTGKPDDSQIMRVVQVKRLTNPKGIYRSYNNNQNFTVELMELKTPRSTTFETFESDGPWMAEVIGDGNFINLNGRQTIKGNSGDIIKFEVRFNKMNHSKTPRNAIIRIRYHNYTCVHLIFVRQGYSAQPITDSGELWHTTNMIHDELEASDPRDEGSLFKYGNLAQGFDSYGNGLGWSYEQLPEATEFRQKAKPKQLYIADKKNDFDIERNENGDPKEYGWSDIKGNTNSDGQKIMSDASVATVENYQALFGVMTGTNASNIKHAFGVLYADGATTVQTALADAWGYNRYDEETEKRGMRGLFVYHWDGGRTSGGLNCHNIFFPIGRAGYGHRRANDSASGGAANSNDGTLRYVVGRDGEMDGDDAMFQPQFFDNYRRQGAIYWARTPKEKAVDVTGTEFGSDINAALAFDINYYTFDVNILPWGNLQKHGQWTGCKDQKCIDACFVRKTGAQTETDKKPQFVRPRRTKTQNRR